MGKDNKLKINWTIQPNSPMNKVLEMLDRTPHAKRTAIETALVDFYFPEVAIQNLQELSPADVWQLNLSIAELESRLKLYRNFVDGLDGSLASLAQTLPKVEHAADVALDVSSSLGAEAVKASKSEYDDDFEDEFDEDDDFNEGGI